MRARSEGGDSNVYVPFRPESQQRSKLVFSGERDSNRPGAAGSQWEDVGCEYEWTKGRQQMTPFWIVMIGDSSVCGG